jgi:hypothetical protein
VSRAAHGWVAEMVLAAAVATAGIVAACGGRQAATPPASEVPVSHEGGPDVSFHDGREDEQPTVAPAAEKLGGDAGTEVDEAAAKAASNLVRDGGVSTPVASADAGRPAEAPAKPAPTTAPTLPKLLHADAGVGADPPIYDAGPPKGQPYGGK